INIETTGVSLHLGKELLIPKPNQTFDTLNGMTPQYDKYDLTQSPYILKPNDFVLGVSKQNIKTDKDIITFIDGRSTYARVGMTVHLSAMVLDGLPFNGENSVLEIKNLGNCDIVLHQNEKIGTYLFAQLSTAIDGEKDSTYSNQTAVTPPIL
ncbi:MAG: hypothetical protein RBT33_01780, partial [Candidatus Dojkabacteria bacterium]|nr:hypothetical protein [Candidatus Dojkabacteria bacterium]